MARAYSNDLRMRVALAVLAGGSVREVAATFRVSVASAVKWSQRLRDTGSAGSRPMGGHKRRVLAEEQGWMLLRLEECPHLTVRGLASELAERGHRVSPNTVWSMLRKAGHSFKKKSVRGRAGSAEDRPAAGTVEEVSGAG
jgi:transposase